MYLGLCSITFRDKSVDELLQLVQEHQLNTIEWGSDVHVRPDDLEQVRAIGRKSAEAGLQEISYGTYYRVGEEENDHSFEELVQAAQALGAKELRVWAGKKGSTTATPIRTLRRPPESSWRRQMSRI